MASALVMYHSWREPAVSNRVLREREDRLVRACVPDLLAFSSFDPLDQSQTAILFVERPGEQVIGAWTVAGALRLAEMLRETLPELADEITASY